VVGWNLFLARYDGAKWTVDPPPPTVRRTAVLSGVWSDGPSNAWAVGPAPVVFHWNGNAWNTVITPTQTQFGNPFAVWGSGNTTVLVGTQFVRCTGEACSVEGSAPDSLYGVWGSSTSNIFAVGRGGHIMRSTGQGWTAMQSPTTRTLRRVWGSGPNDVWAVGDSVLLRFNGTAWQPVPMTGVLAQMQSAPTSQNVVQAGLWGASASDVYLGGNSGRIAHFDGVTWRLMNTPTQRRILAISGVRGTGALAIADAQPAIAGPDLLRGVSASGGFSRAMTASAIWY
jgi:hypothetical protein